MFIESSIENAEMFFSALGKIRSYNAVLEELGLSGHPVLENLDSESKPKLVKQLVYHGHQNILYGRMPDVRYHNRPDLVRVDGRPDPVPSGDLPLPVQLVWRRYALAYVAVRLREANRPHFFSLPLQQHTLRRLTYLLAGPRSSEEEEGEDGLETIFAPMVDFEHEVAPHDHDGWPAGVEYMLFMRPVFSGIKDAVRALPEQGGKLLASDVGVTCHSVGSCDALQRYITVVADPIRAKLLDEPCGG